MHYQTQDSKHFFSAPLFHSARQVGINSVIMHSVGSGHAFSLKHMFFSSAGPCHGVILFQFMFALVLGQRPDGSRVLLARPHGRPLRVGTPAFRNLFLPFGSSSRVRTVVFQFVGPTDWYRLQATTDRLFFFSSTSLLQWKWSPQPNPSI